MGKHELHMRKGNHLLTAVSKCGCFVMHHQHAHVHHERQSLGRSKGNLGQGRLLPSSGQGRFRHSRILAARDSSCVALVAS